MLWRKNKWVQLALWFLGVLLFVAFAQGFLANGRPLYCRINGETFYPGLRSDFGRPYGHPVLDSIRQRFLWRQYPYESAIFAPVAFSPGELPMTPDTTIKQARPGELHPGTRFRHWLGTDDEGHDVAAGLIGGARVALLTGALATCLAFGIGIILGAVAGYWGDNRLRIRRGQLWFILAGSPVAWFYASAVQQHFGGNIWWQWVTALPTFFGFLWIFSFTGKYLTRTLFFQRHVIFPADLVVMRAAEVFTALPGLLVIIAFAAMLKQQTQTLWPMVILIGIFGWPDVARFIRGELLRVREMEYITAARGMGLNEWRILSRHALPNALRPALTVFAFGVSSAILLEAGLSFLGYGDSSLHGATWGSLLQNARSSPQLWWICLPPGLAICLTILSLSVIGDALSERR